MLRSAVGAMLPAPTAICITGCVNRLDRGGERLEVPAPAGALSVLGGVLPGEIQEVQEGLSRSHKVKGAKAERGGSLVVGFE